MSRNDHQKRLLELHNEKIVLQGYNVINSLKSLFRTYYTLEKNYDELMNLIVRCENELIFKIFEDGILYNNMKLEISRMLHNYYSSIQSLIDHTRRIKEKLNNNELNISWQNEITILLNNDCTKFSKKFRNYIQHYEIPVLHSKFHISNPDGLTPEKIKNRDATFIYNMHVDQKELLIWDNWNSASKRYIKNLGKELELKSLLSDYYNLNYNFYDWFYNKIYSLYGDEINKVNEIDEKMRQIINGREKL